MSLLVKYDSVPFFAQIKNFAIIFLFVPTFNVKRSNETKNLRLNKCNFCLEGNGLKARNYVEKKCVINQKKKDSHQF